MDGSAAAGGADSACEFSELDDSAPLNASEYLSSIFPPSLDGGAEAISGITFGVVAILSLRLGDAVGGCGTGSAFTKLVVLALREN